MAKMVDHMEKLLRGEAPQPPAAVLISMRLDSFTSGEATVVLDADASSPRWRTPPWAGPT